MHVPEDAKEFEKIVKENCVDHFNQYFFYPSTTPIPTQPPNKTDDQLKSSAWRMVNECPVCKGKELWRYIDISNGTYHVVCHTAVDDYIEQPEHSTESENAPLTRCGWHVQF